MATFIFDFDDTLFDNTQLKKDIFNILKSFSVPEKVILESYKNARNSYNFISHLEEIKKIHNIILEEVPILENLNKLSFSDYVFPETQEILRELSKKHKLILLSFGEEHLQKKKIEESNLANNFNQIHVTQENKVHILKQLELDSDIFFLNDKIYENELVKKEFPHFKVILISKDYPVSKAIRQI